MFPTWSRATPHSQHFKHVLCQYLSTAWRRNLSLISLLQPAQVLTELILEMLIFTALRSIRPWGELYLEIDTCFPQHWDLRHHNWHTHKCKKKNYYENILLWVCWRGKMSLCFIAKIGFGAQGIKFVYASGHWEWDLRQHLSWKLGFEHNMGLGNGLCNHPSLPSRLNERHTIFLNLFCPSQMLRIWHNLIVSRKYLKYWFVIPKKAYWNCSGQF